MAGAQITQEQLSACGRTTKKIRPRQRYPSADSMTQFSKADHRYMAHALRLARKGLTTAHPNPRVGCVLVQDGFVIGEGWHRAAGEAHAEVNAIAAAGGSAEGATAYVTLEPCASTGRTGPCTEALIRAGVARVIFAAGDPSQHSDGRQSASLGQAGIEVSGGLMQEEARRLNEGFLMRVTQQRPFVRLKVAASLDGATAMRDGQSQWITGEAARGDVQKLRAMSGAVMSGVGTVLADDPLLTVRDTALVLRQPLRVVIDSRLRTPPAARLLMQPGATAIFCTEDRGHEALEKAGAAVYRVATNRGRVDLAEVLLKLAELEVNDVLVEAGPGLSGSLVAGGHVDELVIYQAPHMMGSETKGIITTPGWTGLDDRLQLDILEVRRVGRDLKIVARPVSSAAGRD
jgi:diaminohydroxyphosphoribosylaminopyrimidine deaminase/5-amino-6-(5-phosphoribosylamino)uracil reductase